ncbi:hypothetical protein CFK37_14795 [Virgibacillus phasianinus]|uniref:ABC transporter periplasmic binding protein yphF n=1 Tax=Virgibacillus phasianinus TaxID=2017483 RepID=A0A220U6I9_9BACI|nr:hypothetical protein [Virgibacillus phasianinus]ASK63333.1 hypothetical protein CFK37_14795 [Virgibacillus phasianinus]
MKFTYMRAIGAVILISLLSGCLYPENELSKNQVPNKIQLESVQSAVDTYREKTNGLVPIKTKDKNTPIFRKYLLDFGALQEKGILAEIPGTAYENGGLYQYALLTPEDNPRVKLIDLRISDAIREVSVQLHIYRNEHMYPPFGKPITKNLYKIDYQKLGFEHEPYVVSPYSQKNLPVIMDTDGKLYVDYRPDLFEALDKYDHSYQTGDDIRYILAENSPFLPVYSYPSTIKNGEPVYMKVKK